MAVPEFQCFMLPVLQLFKDNKTHTTNECMNTAIEHFKLDENDIKSTVQLEQELKNTKINVYKKDVELDVIAMLMLSLDEVTEQEKDVARAEYNLISNNEIFRFLNYLLFSIFY